MQPVAEIALVHFGVQFVRLLQPELAQREKPVRAAAQVFIGAGRQFGQRQPRSGCLRPLRRRCMDVAQAACVAAFLRRPFKLERQNQWTGQQHFATVVAAAPQHVAARRLQRATPACADFLFQLFARPQPQPVTLRGGPRARGFRRHRQTDLVATGQHQRREWTAEQLVERQDHHVFLPLRLGHEARCFERVIHPRSESGQRKTPRRLRQLLEFGFRAGRQSQCRDHPVAGGVPLQQFPLTGCLQQGAQRRQPLRQRFAALHVLAPLRSPQHQRGHGLAVPEVGGLQARPVAHPGAPDPPLERQHGDGVQHRRVLQPIQRRVTGSVPRTGPQRRHQVRGSPCR